MAKLIRRGKCFRCGQCCTELVLWDHKCDADTADWDDRLRYLSSFAGVRVRKAANGWIKIVVSGLRCRHLSYTNAGLARCNLHKRNKPMICRKYPDPKCATTIYGACLGGMIEISKAKQK